MRNIGITDRDGDGYYLLILTSFKIFCEHVQALNHNLIYSYHAPYCLVNMNP